MDGLNDAVDFRLGNCGASDLLHKHDVNSGVAREQLFGDSRGSRLWVLELKSFEILRLNRENARVGFGHGMA
jgi:hypothetical protein